MENLPKTIKKTITFTASERIAHKAITELKNINVARGQEIIDIAVKKYNDSISEILQEGHNIKDTPKNAKYTVIDNKIIGIEWEEPQNN